MAHILYNSAYAPSVQFIRADNVKIIQRTGFEDEPEAAPRLCRETEMDLLLEDVCRHEELERLVLIVPTARRVRHLQAQIIRKMHAMHGKPTRQPHIFTLARFVQYCFKNVCNARKRRVVSEGYRLALFEEAVEAADLQFFARNGKSVSPATLERLANLVWGLKKDGITPQSLRDDVRRAESGAAEGDYDIPRLRDIAALFESYQNLLGETFLDEWEQLKITQEIIVGERDCETLEKLVHPDNSHVAKCGRITKIFPKANLVFVEGFSEFKEPELEFLSLFTNCSIPLAIRVDYGESGPLFSTMYKTVDKLRAVGFGDCYLDEEKPFKNSIEDARITVPLGAYLRRWLFNTEREIRHPGFSNVGQIIAAENRLEEVRAIAKLIRNLSVNHGIPLSEIGVVMRQSDRYTDLFREMFAAYTIPSNITDRPSLSKSPVSIAVFAVLDIILRGYRRDDIHRALQSPYLQFFKKDRNGEKIPLNGSNLYDVALRLRISGGDRRGGKDALNRRFEKSLESLERWVSSLKSDEFADEFELERAEREFEQTALAYSDFKALCAMLPEKGRKYSPAEFTNVVKNGIIKNFAVRESIVQFHDHVQENSSKIPVEYIRFQEEVEKDARAYSALVKLLDEMTFIYSERDGNSERTLEEFAQRFKTAVMAARYGVREKVGLGVTVTAVEQTRGTPFTVMILCGAVDGEFPGRYVPESFLGKELPESEERFIENERLQFYGFLTNNLPALERGEKKLFITYPKFSQNGDELVRSPFIDALLKVTRLQEDECSFDGHELMMRHSKGGECTRKENSAVEWLTAIGSDDEVLKIIGAAHHSGQKQKIQASVSEQIDSIIDTYVLDEPVSFIRSMVGRKGDDFITGKILLKDLEGTAEERLQGFKNHSFSISELETYAKCGYKFFSHRLLALKEKAGEDSQTLSAIERGTLFHTVLFKFYRKIQDEQLKNGETQIIAKAKIAGMPPLAPVRLDVLKQHEYSQLLKEIAREELSRISYENVFFTMEQEELLGTPEKKGQLDIWLEQELLKSEKWQFVPVLFETAFGMGNSSKGETVEPVKIGDVSLRGKIDRIEILKDADGWKFLVADYKSSAGAVPTIGDLHSGQAFQVPLYLAAAQDFLEKCYGIEATPAGGAYYIFNPRFNKKTKSYEASKPFLVPNSLKDKVGSRGHKSWLENEGALYNSIEATGAAAEDMAFKMTEGNFHAEPSHDKHCGQCSYGSVCRIREVNVRDSEDERTGEDE
ncbi:MAG: PD-(D/E)XK nuclease family protein [Bacteroidota bacterium]